MADIDLRSLIESHHTEIEAVGNSLIEGQKEKAVSQLAGLFVSVLTGIPGLGALAKAGLDLGFGRTANACLDRQLDSWRKEQDRQELVDRVAGTVEVLIGQLLIQIIRSQHQLTDETKEALGGIRDDLAEFGSMLERETTQADVHVGIQRISGGGIGIRVSEKTRQTVFVDEMRVAGRGSIGIDLS